MDACAAEDVGTGSDDDAASALPLKRKRARIVGKVFLLFHRLKRSMRARRRKIVDYHRLALCRRITAYPGG